MKNTTMKAGFKSAVVEAGFAESWHTVVTFSTLALSEAVKLASLNSVMIHRHQHRLQQVSSTAMEVARDLVKCETLTAQQYCTESVCSFNVVSINTSSFNVGGNFKSQASFKK